MKNLQQQVLLFCEKNKLLNNSVMRFLDLVSEIGELSKEFLIQSDYGDVKPLAVSKDVEQEIGDILFSLICLSNAVNIDLENALNAVLEKYQKRIDVKNNSGSL